jgi:hypothetical protein
VRRHRQLRDAALVQSENLITASAREMGQLADAVVAPKRCQVVALERDAPLRAG